MTHLNHQLALDTRNQVKQMKNDIISAVFQETDNMEDELLLKTLGNNLRFLQLKHKK
jgi:hypothetical protein